ncbi:peptidase M16 [Geothermobacter hydrogeniphilus]|uniref:Peptidase M16 n=1 Tax=Geothermobacter hydrogeniphilus TaxID=1969733 RepID=A0A2K2HBV4_9BACT|nr:insulinase family protein [Geothermobacter hydrogeniphilus]PNU20786.1 peptidase M16 [Geothermobacter hydrogeniphilus]
MQEPRFHPGETISGFLVHENETIATLNLQLIRLEHQQTGARYLHLATEDPNNLFAVGFRTPPKDSTGVAHILEHTVLCGSRRYPVRDPFFSMLKRSLNTFMNAMTASDWTCYPFASQNRTDFDNLLGIYLDAVFFPLLREQDFLQEGHRLEFADRDNPSSKLTIQGVVYNEMKGAMASPSSLLSRRLARALYPTTTYHHNSGGEPSEIPKLSWQQLREFHAAYYHPSNSWLFSYGNFPLAEHLENVEERALRHFTRRPVASEVPSEQRLDQPRVVEEPYALAADENPQGKSMVQVAWLTSDIEDHELRLAQNLLSVLLLGNPAAPLYRALLESRLGSNLAPGCGYHDDNRTTYFAAGLQGTDPERAGQIEQLILQTLEQAATTGFEPERVEGALHRLEFVNREVSGDSYPYPLGLLMRLFGPWLHADEAAAPLRIDLHLQQLRKRLRDPAYLPEMIRRLLLDNPHRVRLLLRPDQTLETRENEQLEKELQAVREQLGPQQARALIKRSAELRAMQEAEEDLSCLPTLSRADIPPSEPVVKSGHMIFDHGTITRFAQPTNGICYLVGHLRADRLPPAQCADLPLFAALLPQIGAGRRDYLQMAAATERYTGGIQAGTEILEQPTAAACFQSTLVIKGKVLTRHRDRLLELLGDTLLAPDFSDLERLQTVLGQFRSSLENSIPGSGHSYAARYAAASLSPAARRREEWSGISLLRRIRTLTTDSRENLEGFAQRLDALAKTLAGEAGPAWAVTADEADLKTLDKSLETFLQRFPTTDRNIPPDEEQSHGSAPHHCGLTTSVPVAYVARVFPTVSYNHPDAAPLMVLAKLLRAGYLHREIREKGGAYGGLAGCDIEGGTLSLLSYRDPHIVRTLGVFDAATHWAAAADFDDSAVDEAVLSVFSDLDRPLSPGSRGSREFANQLQGLTPELRQQFRERVLAVRAADLARVAEAYLVANRKKSAVTVVAGREMIEKANQELETPLAVEAI